MSYQVPQHIDPNKVFLINLSNIERRLDPEPYHNERINAINKIKQTSHYLPLSSIASFEKEITKNIRQGDKYLGLENISSEYGEYVETTEKESISSAAIFHKGDILFPKLRPYLNKVFFATFDGICSTEFYVLKSNSVNAEYLSIFLRSSLVVNQTKHLMTGNTLPRLQTEDVRDLLIPIPSIIIQQRIIDCYNAAYTQKLQKEEQAKALLQSIDGYLLNELGIQIPETKSQTIQDRMFVVNFSEASGERLDPMFYAADIKKYTHCTYSESIESLTLSCNSGFAVGRQDQIDQANGILQIRPTNIDNNGQLKYDKNVYVPENNGIQFVPSGVVLFNNTNSQEWVGKTAYFSNEEKRNVYISNHITAINVDKSKILPMYLSEILNMYQRHKVFYSICTNWNNQSGIGLDLLSILHIPLFTDDRQRSLVKQQEIVNHISSIRQQAKALQEEGKAILEQAKKEVEQMILG